MEPVVDRNGDMLLEMIRLPDESAIDPVVWYPIVASVVVVEREGRVLFVSDRYRGHWELPGGKIEEGESLRECAIRELMEESGQSALQLTFVGLARLQLVERGTKYVAVYAAHLGVVAPFTENNEISRINWWDFRADIGYIDDIDRALAEMIVGGGDG